MQTKDAYTEYICKQLHKKKNVHAVQMYAVSLSNIGDEIISHQPLTITLGT